MIKQIIIIFIIVLIVTGCNKDDNLQKFRQFINRTDLSKLKIGKTHLPESQKSLTTDGCIYVAKLSDSRLVIIFDTWIGKGPNMEGYLYSSSALTGEDFSKDYYGNVVIELSGIQYVIKRTPYPNWYRIQFNLS